MHIINKKDCTFKHGYIISADGAVCNPGYKIVNQLNKLELMVQKYDYLRRQPEYQPMPSLRGFERMSIKDTMFQYDVPETPNIDAQVAKAQLFATEIDNMSNIMEVNKHLREDWSELLEFCDGEDFMADDSAPGLIDTPVLGDPLELSVEYVMSIIKQMVVHPAVDATVEKAGADVLFQNGIDKVTLPGMELPGQMFDIDGDME